MWWSKNNPKGTTKEAIKIWIYKDWEKRSILMVRIVVYILLSCSGMRQWLMMWSSAISLQDKRAGLSLTPPSGRWGNHEEGKEASASACTVWFPFEPFDSERRRNSGALFPLRSTSSYWNPVPRRGRHFSLYLNKQWFLPRHFHGVGRKRPEEGWGEENKTQSVIHRKRFKEKVKGWREGRRGRWQRGC